MNTLEKSAETAAKLHPANILKTILSTKPADASMAAVSQYKAALIFYKNDGKYLFADYGNGRGWERIRHRKIDGLAKDLAACAFVLTDLNALETILMTSKAEDDVNPMQVLKARVDAQFVRVDGRRSTEKNNEDYWQGQYDAYEIVQGMMRDLAV